MSSPDPPGAAVDILIVDDEPTMAQLIEYLLQLEGYRTQVAHDPAQALARCTDWRPDLVICDIRLGLVDGFDVLDLIRARHPGVPAIIVTGFPSAETRQRARDRLAFDYLEKPFERETLVRVVDRALKASPADEPKVLWAPEMMGLFGSSPGMRRVFQEIHELARTDTPVLILGESGCGKERVARAIHQLSHRKAQPFLLVSAGSVPPEDESRDLDRTDRGAAVFYVDEVLRLSPTTREAIQAGVVSAPESPEDSLRLDPGRMTLRDCRFLLASRIDEIAPSAAANAKPTEGLPGRIGAVALRIPPLRERVEDIPVIARHYLEVFGRELGKPDLSLTMAGWERLADEPWPGNVRELVHLIRRLTLAATASALGPAEVQAALDRRRIPPDPTTPRLAPGMTLDEARGQAVRATLAALDGNVSATARLMGLDRRTVMRFRGG